MLIDWFTVVAQAVNFLILVWLMKRYLYTPILNAIDAREKLIAAELADAATKKKEAKIDRDEFQAKNDKFDEQRNALLKKANDEAKAELERLLAEADKAADALSARRHQVLVKEAHALNDAIRHRAGHEVFAIARKTLADLASVSLEERMADVLISRLKGIDVKTKEKIADGLTKSSEPAVVRTAFDLPKKQRTSIENAFNLTFSTGIEIQFETEPDLISGIEFSASGQKVAWSISDYLSSLEEGVDEILKNDKTRESEAAEKTEAKSTAHTNPDASPPSILNDKSSRKSGAKSLAGKTKVEVPEPDNTAPNTSHKQNDKDVHAPNKVVVEKTS